MQARAMEVACRVLNGFGTRPTARQWRARWPGMPRFSPLPYVDTRGEQERIGFVVVDLGGPVKHVMHKARRLHRRLGELPAFRALCASDRCLIAVITGGDAKAELLRDALEDQLFDCQVEVLVNPDLFAHILRVRR